MNLVRGGTLTALAWLVAIGCGGSGTDNVAGGGPPPDPGTGVEGTPDAGEPLPDPPPAVIGEPIDGVFVSASKGSDENDSTYLRPLKTIARAMVVAAEKKTLPVYVCAETYNEAVKLGDGVAMYGAYDCSGTKYKPTSARAKIVSPSGPALVADGLTLPAKIDGFEFQAPGVATTPNPAVPAASSFGAVVRNSVSLALANVRIVAGNGQDGIDGVESSEVNGFTSSSGIVGGAANGADQHGCITVGGSTSCNFNSLQSNSGGGLGGVGNCKFGAPGGPGGKGGSGRVWFKGSYRTFMYDERWTKGQPLAEEPETAAGGTQGKSGARGAFGANGAWSFADGGLLSPGDGSAGATGAPGQGGGGGDGRANFGGFYDGQGNFNALKPEDPQSVWRTGYGGGGGAGGCGGAAGTAGRGGGGSIGLHVVASKVTIAATEILAGNGGRGGIGAGGLAGAAGAAGGAPAVTPYPLYPVGAPGFAGGPGGKGGQSGHGAPGPSIALVYHGEKPTMTDVQLKFGNAGAAGPAVTDGAQTLPAPAQVAQGEYTY